MSNELQFLHNFYGVDEHEREGEMNCDCAIELILYMFISEFSCNLYDWDEQVLLCDSVLRNKFLVA